MNTVTLQASTHSNITKPDDDDQRLKLQVLQRRGTSLA